MNSEFKQDRKHYRTEIKTITKDNKNTAKNIESLKCQIESLTKVLPISTITTPVTSMPQSSTPTTATITQTSDDSNIDETFPTNECPPISPKTNKACTLRPAKNQSEEANDFSLSKEIRNDIVRMCRDVFNNKEETEASD